MTLSELNGTYLFTADWCGPCKTIKARLPQDTNVVIIDVDVELALSREVGIKAVPHLLVVEGGEVKQSLRGYVDIEPVLFPRQ